MDEIALERPTPEPKTPRRTTKIRLSIDVGYDGDMVVLKASLTEDADKMPFLSASRALVSRLIRTHKDFDAAWEHLLRDIRQRVLDRQTNNPLFLAMPDFVRPVQRIVPEGAVPMLEHLKDRHRGIPALVIGNGLSRKDIDLGAWPGVTIGCNALIRDFVPDYLVVFDEAMVEEVVALQRHKILLCRKSSWGARTIDEKTFLFPHDAFPPQTLCAGAAAYWAAIVMGCSPITLVGFDGVARPGNLYAETPNYPTRCTDPDIVSEHDLVLLRVADFFGPEAKDKTFLVWPPGADHSMGFQRISWEAALERAYGQGQGM